MNVKLSDTQILALAEAHMGLTEFAAVIVIGRSWRRTMAKLESRGLVIFRPYAMDGKGAYKLTPAGREQVSGVDVTRRSIKDGWTRDLYAKRADESFVTCRRCRQMMERER